jgi:hypothetical protein
MLVYVVSNKFQSIPKMDFPTPEEEYELMYGEELEMMDDLDGMLREHLKFTKMKS